MSTTDTKPKPHYDAAGKSSPRREQPETAYAPFVAPAGYVLVTGKTYPVKDRLKIELGAVYDGNGGWWVPARNELIAIKIVDDFQAKVRAQEREAKLLALKRAGQLDMFGEEL